jgi:drug/metabolite transporter (DMT)-like permease
MEAKQRSTGIRAACLSATLLGLIPVAGKQAILAGFTPLMVVAFRTTLATFLLFIIMLIFSRKYFYIHPMGLLGCVLAGLINGTGSVLFYIGLSRLEASVSQLLFSFYPLFVAVWLFLDRQPLSKITWIRLLISVPGTYLLLSYRANGIDILGAVLVLLASALYGLHLIINQRVLYEAPAQTVALYTLLAMSLTVVVSYLIFDHTLPAAGLPWNYIFILSILTFLSRLTLFTGIKNIGGMQTALLGLAELLITVGSAYILLHEVLSPLQWVGAAILFINLLLVGYDRTGYAKHIGSGLLGWLNPPQIKTSEIPWKSQP